VLRTIGRRARLRWVAAAVAGAALVAGCGQVQAGAAAIYGNQRITSAKLADEVANLNAGYQQYRSKLQLTYPKSAMPRQVLSWMLRFATAEQIARQRGIVVTPAQSQRELAIEAARIRPSGNTLAEAAVANGLPPDLLPELGRWFAIELALQKQLDGGTPPTTAAGSQALTRQVGHLQCLAAKSLNIKVNPQYGGFDYSQFAVVPLASKLSAAPGAVKPVPAPQLTPAC
jgi:outer membrane murein-binding lipoprotein Lpp